MYKGNESNLECLDEVAEQLNPWHLVANKAIHTQKETEVYMQNAPCMLQMQTQTPLPQHLT